MVWDWLHSLPLLAKFALGMAIIVGIPPLSRRARLPAVVGSPVARMTMWSLTLPQVAATLAATLVAFDTRNPAGQRLVDNRLLNVVLVMMLTTSILGPVLTEHFAPRLLKNATPP
jgi:Kef-type K+ transport system membrane component KefB